MLRLLAAGLLSKAELSRSLGQKQISDQPHKVLRRLVTDRTIEYTLLDKPQSRLQKHRLTNKGRTAVTSLRPGSAGL